MKLLTVWRENLEEKKWNVSVVFFNTLDHVLAIDFQTERILALTKKLKVPIHFQFFTKKLLVWKSIAHDPALSTKSFPNLLAGLANNLVNRPKFPPAFDPTIELLEINWNFMVFFYLELTYKYTMMMLFT